MIIMLCPAKWPMQPRLATDLRPWNVGYITVKIILHISALDLPASFHSFYVELFCR